jgi:hypothetical protein
VWRRREDESSLVCEVEGEASVVCDIGEKIRAVVCEK